MSLQVVQGFVDPGESQETGDPTLSRNLRKIRALCAPPRFQIDCEMGALRSESQRRRELHQSISVGSRPVL